MSPTNKDGKILVLGAGNFGTCLANHLATEGWNVEIWARSQAIVDSINNDHKNPKYLSTIKLAPTLRAINTIEEKTIKAARMIVVAVPMQGMREVLMPIAQHFSKFQSLVCAVKGIEVQSSKFPTDVFAEIFGTDVAKESVVLSGPSFAIEVAQRLPTAVVAASHDISRALETQRVFHSSFFRVYTSHDPIGLEVAGALKNVIAIAAGACAGMGLQMNSMAALMTRGLAEITHVGAKLGANPLTFQGLGGVGDLFLTCSSPKSRNYSLGFKIGEGLSVEDALASLGSVAEGYTTAIPAYKLCSDLQVDAPIIEQVYRVLYEGKPIQTALMDLVTRDAKAEFNL